MTRHKADETSLSMAASARNGTDAMSSVAPSDPLQDAGGAAAVAPPRTLAGRLRMQISDDIVRGALAPGVVLDEMELARRFQVSRTPVREAIRLLVASGLVEARPHRSAVVARPDKAQLAAMFEALRELEALCAGLAAERMTGAEIAGLRAAHRAMLGVVRSDDPQRYHEVNEEFHAKVYAGAHNPYLVDLTLATRARIAPFSRAQFRAGGRLGKSHKEHERVIAAIAKRNREAASALMRDHIGFVYDAYADYRPA
jgi:DNA-binding GntR family transcriptional regulator